MDLTTAPRSWLFVPGDSARKIEKAQGVGADILIYDLEDSVAADGKAAARALVAETLAQRTGPVCVRVNDLKSGHFAADLDAISPVPPALIMLPKCEGLVDVATLAQAMADRGMGSRVVPIATETTRGVRALMTDRWDHPRLAGITWGAEDLAADLGALRNRGAAGYEGTFALVGKMAHPEWLSHDIQVDTAFADIDNDVDLDIDFEMF